MNTRDMFPLYEVPKMREYTSAEIRACKTLGEAYAKTMELSKLERKQIAAKTGLHKETLSMMASGIRNCPPDKLFKFYEVCQNLYALQWQAAQFGKMFKDIELTQEEKTQAFDRLMAANQ